jgi:hypothetical protein
MKKRKYFKIYAHCVLVEGSECSLIIDFYHKKYLKVSSPVGIFLKENMNDFQVDEDLQYVEQQDNLLFNVIDVLYKNGMGFFASSPGEFKSIDVSCDESPDIINNAIIEIEEIEFELHKKVFEDLNVLLCKYIEVWFSEKCTFCDIAALVNGWNSSVLRGARVFVDAIKMNTEELFKFNNLQQLSGGKIDEIVLYNCMVRPVNLNSTIIYTKSDLSNLNYQGNKYNKIVMEMSFFVESKNRNPFYYKKICIDREGNIKNFLANNEIFGNIKTDSLNNICLSPNFQRLWYATTDKIVDIKDSPMRYCYSITDDLIPLENGYFKMKTELTTFPWNKIV